MMNFKLEKLKQELFEEKETPIERFKKLLILAGQSNNVNVKKALQVSNLFKNYCIIDSCW